jgi:hypothetical protein
VGSGELSKRKKGLRHLNGRVLEHLNSLCSIGKGDDIVGEISLQRVREGARGEGHTLSRSLAAMPPVPAVAVGATEELDRGRTLDPLACPPLVEAEGGLATRSR